MRDAVLGAAMGYTFAQVSPFLHSLRRAGFAGEVVLFVTPKLSTPDRAAMRAAGATLVFVQRELCRLSKGEADRRFSDRLNSVHRRVGPLLAGVGGGVGHSLREGYSRLFHHPVVSRYTYYLRFLRSRPGRYRRVMLSDVRDVVFQADPLAALPDAPLVCALETDRVRIGNEPSNTAWVRRFYGEGMLTRLADCRVSCAGTTFGTHAGVTAYLEAMVREMVGMGERAVGEFGPDQTAHNKLLWTGGLPGAGTTGNGERVVFTAQGEDLTRFRITDGVLLAADGAPVAAVHMYDRVAELRGLRAAP